MKEANDSDDQRRRVEEDAAEILGTEDEKLQEEVDQALGVNGGMAVFDGMEVKMLQKEVIRKILEGLTETEKSIFELHRGEDLSPQEIADLMGENVYWVEYQLTKIEAKIRDRAKQYLKASGKKSF